jgi:endonuclease/exonuclease/phosphatase family metal-dependent hydrolase
MAGLLVRSWNVFHGNTVPPTREQHLEEMIRRATADEPDVLCLQELPAWSVDHLAEWSGMTVEAELTERPAIGPMPVTPGIGRRLTEINHGLIRSAFAGQANAILLAPALRTLDRHAIVLNPPRFRSAQARWLGLPPIARLSWASERRVCHAVSVGLPDGGRALVANLHATNYRPDERLADAEVLRAAVFADAVAEPDEACILAGDFNVRTNRSWTLRDLTGPEWQFAGGGPWVDHVYARGSPIARVTRWPDERRRIDGRLLSDHAAVETRVG